MKWAKWIVVAVLSFAAVFLLASPASAHPANIDLEVEYGDSIGWAIFPQGQRFDGIEVGHMNAQNGQVTYTLVLGSNFNIPIPNSGNQTYEDAIHEGVAMWNNTGLTNITVATTAPTTGFWGTIRNQQDNTAYGWFDINNSFVDSNWHYEADWSVVLNTSTFSLHINAGVFSNLTSAEIFHAVAETVAHELGHGFGLAHVSGSANANKLMANGADSNRGKIPAPTAEDLQGFRLITGIETAHSFQYTNSSSSQHSKQCTQCKGTGMESHGPFTVSSTGHSCAGCGYSEGHVLRPGSPISLPSQCFSEYCNKCPYIGYKDHRLHYSSSSGSPQHYTQCFDCSYKAYQYHSWTSWYVYTQESCTSNGLRTRDCIYCTNYETEIIPASHTGGTATCTSPKTCTRCGTSYGSALGHTGGTATCTSPKTCTRCGTSYGSSLGGHTGGTATCTALARCTRCNTSYGSLRPHTPSSSWTITATEHYKLCTGCSAKSSQGTHSVSANCSTCGRMHTTHTAAASWSKDSTNHWKACTVSGCTTKLSLAGHSGGTATCTTKANCSSCGTSYGNLNSTNHSVGTNAVTKTATCSTTGIRTYYCGRVTSHIRYTETIPVNNVHARSGTVSRTIAATCTSAKKTYYKCQYSSAHEYPTPVTSGSALGHSWSVRWNDYSSAQHRRSCTRSCGSYTYGSHYLGSDGMTCGACGRRGPFAGTQSLPVQRMPM